MHVHCSALVAGEGALVVVVLGAEVRVVSAWGDTHPDGGAAALVFADAGVNSLSDDEYVDFAFWVEVVGYGDVFDRVGSCVSHGQHSSREMRMSEV